MKIAIIVNGQRYSVRKIYTKTSMHCIIQVEFSWLYKIIINGPNTKPFPAALMLSPFGFYGDILKLAYTTSSCGAMVSATNRKPAISIENIAHRV